MGLKYLQSESIPQSNKDNGLSNWSDKVIHISPMGSSLYAINVIRMATFTRNTNPVWPKRNEERIILIQSKIMNLQFFTSAL